MQEKAEKIARHAEPDDKEKTPAQASKALKSGKKK